MSKLEVIRDLDLFDSAVELVLENHEVSEDVAKEIVEELYKTHKVDDVEIYSQEYANLLNKVDEDIETHSFVFDSYEGVEKYMDTFAKEQMGAFEEVEKTRENAMKLHREYVLTQGWLIVLNV